MPVRPRGLLRCSISTLQQRKRMRYRRIRSLIPTYPCRRISIPTAFDWRHRTFKSVHAAHCSAQDSPSGYLTCPAVLCRQSWGWVQPGWREGSSRGSPVRRQTLQILHKPRASSPGRSWTYNHFPAGHKIVSSVECRSWRMVIAEVCVLILRSKRAVFQLK